jgi:hypothetical protein
VGLKFGLGYDYEIPFLSMYIDFNLMRMLIRAFEIVESIRSRCLAFQTSSPSPSDQGRCVLFLSRLHVFWESLVQLASQGS